jgi:hypothetical protein
MSTNQRKRLNSMVNLVNDWDVFEKYAKRKKGFWQETISDGVTNIRVRAGNCGFIREFANREDKLLTRIMDLCRRQRYIKVVENVPDEDFFE